MEPAVGDAAAEDVYDIMEIPPEVKAFLAALESGVEEDDDDDDNDCVMLDGDPDKAAAVGMDKKPAEDDGSDEECQIISEKGEVACRDFPHPRHLCARLPFETSSHANHCTMCHCYVCDCHAPCPNWGNGTLPTDHCHATDNDQNWQDLRQLFKCKDIQAPKPNCLEDLFRSTSSTLFFQPHQSSVSEPFPHSGAIVNQPHLGMVGMGIVPVAGYDSQNQQMMNPSMGVAHNAVSQPLSYSGTTVNQPYVGRVPVASSVSQNQQTMHPSMRVVQNTVSQPLLHSGTTVNQPYVGGVPVASNVIQNQQMMHPSMRAAQNRIPQPLSHSRTTPNQSYIGRVPVASNVIQNQRSLHPSIRAAQNVVPQPLSHSRTTLNQSYAGRVPVASNVSQNQQMQHPYITAAQNAVPQPFSLLERTINRTFLEGVNLASNSSQNQRRQHPSTRAAHNAGQGGHLPKASALGPKATGRRFKRSGAAPSINKTTSNTSNLATLHPASSCVIQTAQVAPGSSIAAGSVHPHPLQQVLNAPVVSQRVQVQPATHLQAAPSRANGAGQQPLQCPDVTAQRTQSAQDSSGDSPENSWQEAVANLAFHLGLSDYNTTGSLSAVCNQPNSAS